MNWLIMGVIFTLQNFASVANSRARNGENLWHHAITNVVANGLYIASLYFISGKFVENILKGGNMLEVLGYFCFFCGCQLLGGLTSHYIAMKYIEGTTKE